jgi:hypothetical protein
LTSKLRRLPKEEVVLCPNCGGTTAHGTLLYELQRFCIGCNLEFTIRYNRGWYRIYDVTSTNRIVAITRQESFSLDDREDTTNRAETDITFYRSQ